MNRKHSLFIGLVALLLVIPAVISSSPNSEIEINNVELSIFEVTNQTLLVEFTALQKTGEPGSHAFELFINNILVDSKTAEFSELNKTQAIKLEWTELNEGVQSFKIKSTGAELEKTIKITDADGKFSVIEITLSSSSIWEVIISFWWLAIVAVVITIAFYLMRKYEIQRTKHGKRLLKRIKKYHTSGVLKDSLYKKARRTLKKKLKP